MIYEKCAASSRGGAFFSLSAFPLCNFIPHDGGDLLSEQADGFHDLVVGHRAERGVQQEPLDADILSQVDDLPGDRLRTAAVERTIFRARNIETPSRIVSPAAFRTDLVHSLLGRWEEEVCGLFIRVPHEAMAVGGDAEGLDLVPCMRRRLLVQFDEGGRNSVGCRR